MAKKIAEREVLSLEEALRMEIFINQALIEILVSKGIITQEEIMKKIAELKTNSKVVLEQSKSDSNLH